MRKGFYCEFLTSKEDGDVDFSKEYADVLNWNFGIDLDSLYLLAIYKHIVEVLKDHPIFIP